VSATTNATAAANSAWAICFILILPDLILIATDLEARPAAEEAVLNDQDGRQ